MGCLAGHGAKRYDKTGAALLCDLTHCLSERTPSQVGFNPRDRDERGNIAVER